MSQIKAKDFFLIGLLVFLLLGCEFLVLFPETFIDGRDISQIMTWSRHWYAIIFHWSLTIIIWMVGVTVLYKWSKKNGLLSELFRFDFDRKIFIMVLAGILIAFLYTVIEMKIEHQTIPQIYREYKGFIKMYGNKAIIVSLFQNIYYFVESILVLYIVAFFQKAGELWFNIKDIPWGGIGLLLTWGLGHLLSHPEGLLYILIWALTAGFIYIFSRKNIYPTFITMFLMFIL